MADELETMIHIYFTTADKGVRNAFAGTGQSRKRSTVITRVLAERLFDKLAINYTWMKYGVEVPKQEVINFINDVLWAVPDDIAKLSGNRTVGSEAATKSITHGLFLAMQLEYNRKFESQDPWDPASPRYIHREKQA
ncbi:hypothetical protein [Agrobacterium rosae]|uniref:Uncharacterized protein n=1 Tax=Agrobacterium rosae TaxID=1972867 RepID=A0A1R3TIX8_9HYPH|nr:hypothetical protein [Agrobacterium rosae]SCX19744.1 hypothetical protein DSM25559_1888 [Agrobacterium rosae]